MASIYDYQATRITGESVDLSRYRGKFVLIVNTASRCGFTPQYKELEALYQDYQERGLEILAFPCNQFGKQEPGSATEIAEFCELNYGVSFPLFEKVKVNGAGAHPLFQYLQDALPGVLNNKIKWNFTKFLISPEGLPLQRFASVHKMTKIRQVLDARFSEQLPASV